MTVGLPTGGIAGVAGGGEPPPEPARDARIHHAAERFEALLLQQLVQVMGRSVGEGGLFGDGAGSGMYAHLFEENLADAMAAGGGIGLRAVIERQLLGPRAYGAREGTGAGAAAGVPFVPRVEGDLVVDRPASGARLEGPTGRLQAAARAMLPGGRAPQWGQAGRLTEQDLASDFRTEGPEGPALFNVRDAAGFQGRYKCNLFAFELARRAGFMVPLVGRTRGWGYMGPDGVTRDAAAGTLRGDWGRVVTGESAASLDSAIVRGERAFLLTGTSVRGRAGHMGIVERIHEVDYDARGAVERVVYDGWEGRADGARHLTRRTWNRYGNPGGRDARGGFEDIAIIELRRPPPGERAERPVHSGAHPSFHDDPSSRGASDRPMAGAEESP
ncbi:MAG: rod-binding protein [Sandaracinaceae bacterium]